MGTKLSTVGSQVVGNDEERRATISTSCACSSGMSDGSGKSGMTVVKRCEVVLRPGRVSPSMGSLNSP